MKRDLFHFDIETVSQYENFDEFKIHDERGSTLFENKFNKMNWNDKYADVNQAYIENAGVISAYGKIVCISFGYFHNGEKKIKSLYGDDEKDIVVRFNEALKYIEKKNFNICGFKINYFDIPWILHKMAKYGIEPCDIIYTYDKKPWDMRVVDMSNDWKSSFFWSYSFDELCYELGVDSPKNSLDGSKVHETYWGGDIDSIVSYCEDDVSSSMDASTKIYKHFNF
jgi:predicted PolB exonuclease-like 3'-5' exonuclease